MCEWSTPGTARPGVESLIRMPVADGLSAIAQVFEVATSTRVVMLTTFNESESAREALRLGQAASLLLRWTGHEVRQAANCLVHSGYGKDGRR